MILTGKGIELAMTRGEILIEPFSREQLNPNSYNLRLGPELISYEKRPRDSAPVHFDLRESPPPGHRVRIPEAGYWIRPGVLYLGSTVERTRSGPPWVPLLEGRSSVGRRGLSVHVSAGFGDIGIDLHWTLELVAVHPIRVYAGDEVAQIYFVRSEGEVELYDGRYQGTTGPTPAVADGE